MDEERTTRQMTPLQGRLASLHGDLRSALGRLEELAQEVGKLEEEVRLWEAAERQDEENLGGLVRYVLCRYPDDQEPLGSPSPTGQGGGP